MGINGKVTKENVSRRKELAYHTVKPSILIHLE